MKRLTIIGLWPDDVVKYCTEKCDCRRYAFDRILYHRGGRDARERICIPVVDRSGAVTTYLDLPVLFLEANAVYLHLDDGSDIFLSNTQMLLIANEVERLRAEAAGTGLKTLEKWFESGLPTAEDYLEPGDEVDADLIDYFLNVLPPRTNRAGLLQVGGEISTATDAMRENLKGICDFEVRLPVDRAPRGRREEQLRMASNQGAEIAWLVMAATCHETFGYGRDRLARLKQNSMNNYKQYLEWEKEDRDLALDRLRRCVQDALKEDLRVTDTDERKGMFSTPGRGPSVYETAAVYSEIFRRARAGRAVAPLAVYSAAKYDETMTAARKRASVMLGL